MLEKMSDFFERRLDIYEEHMLTAIESAREFYPFTASLLPRGEGCVILDLGCGTGLELDELFLLDNSTRVVGIDLSRAMLDVLSNKPYAKNLTLICTSYLDYPFEAEAFDAAVSVESLHHFTREEKGAFYKKLFGALKPGASFVLTDYFAESDGEESRFFKELSELVRAEGLSECELYHFDTPLTLAHEMEILAAAGFCSVRVEGRWGATATVVAEKPLPTNLH